MKSPSLDDLLDTGDDATLKAMCEGLVKKGHQFAHYRVGFDHQCGWRFASRGLDDVWGMELPTARRALEDATQRFVKALQGRAIYSYVSPAFKPGAIPTGSPMPPELDGSFEPPLKGSLKSLQQRV